MRTPIPPTGPPPPARGPAFRRAAQRLGLMAVIVLGMATARGEEAASPAASIPSPRWERPQPVLVRPEGSKSSARPGSIAPVMGATVALLAVAGGASWFARRGVSPGTKRVGQGIEVVGRATVGPRQGVVVVKVGAERLILGVGGQGPPTLLARMAEAEVQPS